MAGTVSSYTAILVMLFCIGLGPTATLAIVMRPKTLRLVLRGTEGTICLAFGLDFVRRLVAIAMGSKAPYPGTARATFNIAMLAIVDLLIWMRLSQWFRHRSRNAAHAREGIQQLEDMGVDTTELRAKAGLTRVDPDK